MSVGSQLRQAREQQQLTLSEVSNATKIQPWVLEALEGDRLADMMSPVYVRGFLLSYAKLLHLDPEGLVAQLVPAQPEPEPAAPSQAEEIPAAWEMPWPTIRRAAGALGAVACVAAVIAVNPLRWLPSLSLAKSQQPQVASVGPVANAPAAPAAQAAPKPVKVVAPALAKPAVKPAPAAASAAKPGQGLKLTLDVKRTTWIQVKVDGKLLARQRFERGSQEQWNGKQRVELIVAQPAYVEANLNGASITPDLLTHRGRILITPKGVASLPDSTS